MKIGILALQGNYDMHSQVLVDIGIEPVNVKYPYELDNVEGLVIPGGESTTIAKLMNRMGFYVPLKSFATDYPVMGTCAGLVLMSKKVIDAEIQSLSLLDIEVQRNGYGRQIYSNTFKINFELNNSEYNIPGSFIRAPMITKLGKSTVVLAKRDNYPVIVKNDKHLGISFHPELDNISILHEYLFSSKETNN